MSGAGRAPTSSSPTISSPTISSPTISSLRVDDAGLAAKSRSAVLDLYSLDARLTSAQSRLASLQLALHRLRAERSSVALQLRLARLDARLSQNRLASRLRFLYDQGNVSTLEVLFGAKSLDDAMAELDDLDRVAAANQDALFQVRSARGRLLSLAHKLAGRERTLGAATREAAATADELGRDRSERSAYVADLAQKRALDSAQIARLAARAQAAEAASLRLTQSTQPAAAAATYAPQQPRMTETSAPIGSARVAVVPMTTDPAVVVQAAGARTVTVTATGYDLSGTTTTGLPAGWGVAAVDPSVIPLGTHLLIPGYGEAIAADTGSSVVGATIDLWFPTAAQAYAWGRRSVTVALH